MHIRDKYKFIFLHKNWYTERGNLMKACNLFGWKATLVIKEFVSPILALRFVRHDLRES